MKNYVLLALLAVVGASMGVTYHFGAPELTQLQLGLALGAETLVGAGIAYLLGRPSKASVRSTVTVEKSPARAAREARVAATTATVAEAMTAVRVQQGQSAETLKARVPTGDSPRYIEVEVVANPEDAATKLLVVTVVGYTGGEFKKRILPKFESVSSVHFGHPTNLGKGTDVTKRQFKAVVSATMAVTAMQTALGAAALAHK